MAAIVFLLAGIAVVAMIWSLDRNERSAYRARVSFLASDQTHDIERSIAHDLSATFALAALVRNGDGEFPDFDRVANELLPFYPSVAELALAPGGVVRQVAPLAGNEKALGLDLLRDPAQKSEALLARNSGKLTLAGPLTLVQGGEGVVGRLPVFLDRDGKPEFWGFTLVVIRVPEGLKAVNLHRLVEQGLAYKLWRIEPGTGVRKIIVASSPEPLIEPVAHTLYVGNTTWTLDTAPGSGWGDPQRLAYSAALGLLVCLLLAYLVQSLLELRLHRRHLETLVGQRTGELRAREAELNRAQSIAGVGSWVLDPVTTALHGSPTAMRILGLDEGGQVNYRSFVERVHPEDRAAVEAAARASLKGQPYDIEFRIVSGADTRWVRSIAELRFDESARMVGALGTVQDISAQKRADAALRASESLYREMFEASPQPMWVWDLQTLAFLAVNGAAVAHYGYSREEFLSMEIGDIRPPEELPRLQRRVARLQQEEVREAGIWRHRKKDGTPIDMEIASHRLLFNGRRAQMVLANDVTERLRVEREQREAHARYRVLFDENPMPMWVFDHETLKFLTVNQAAIAHYGYSREEFLAMRATDVRPPAEAQQLLQRLAQVQDAEAPDVGRWKHRKKDGTLIDVEYAAHLIDFGGHRAHIVHLNDVTERLRAEKALARRNDLYNLLSQTNQAIVRVTSRDELFPVICRNAVEFGRFTFAWIAAIDPRDGRFRPVAQYGADAGYMDALRTYADEQADPERWRGPLGRALRAGEHVISNDFLGDPLAAPWHEAAKRAGVHSGAAFPIREREAVVGAICLYSAEPGYFSADLVATLDEMALDVSFGLTVQARERERQRAEQALKSSEDKFKRAFYVNPDAININRLEDGLYVSVNRGFTEIMGYAEADVVGRTSLEFNIWDDPNDRARLVQGLERDGVVTNLEARFRAKDGSIRIGLMSAALIDIDGVAHSINITRDITERKQHEIELRRVNELLEQRVAARTQALETANSELEAFSYSVSHDLRMPLRAIAGFARLIETEYGCKLDEQGRDYARRVSAGAERMGQLIHDLLELSRLSSKEMQTAVVELSALAREAAQDLQATEPARKVEWVIAPQAWARGDPGLLRVVLQNLLANAWKYSSRRELARIEFGIGERDGRTIFFVRDNGAGFDMDRARRLFGAFQRLHSESDFPGTGIGLATVARIVRRHGGNIWADSREGEGATFRFYLDSANGGSDAI